MQVLWNQIGKFGRVHTVCRPVMLARLHDQSRVAATNSRLDGCVTENDSGGDQGDKNSSECESPEAASPKSPYDCDEEPNRHNTERVNKASPEYDVHQEQNARKDQAAAERLQKSRPLKIRVPPSICDLWLGVLGGGVRLAVNTHFQRMWNRATAVNGLKCTSKTRAVVIGSSRMPKNRAPARFLRYLGPLYVVAVGVKPIIIL